MVGVVGRKKAFFMFDKMLINTTLGTVDFDLQLCRL